MAREIKFRGKVFNYGKDCGWVYGYYHCEYTGNFYSCISTIDPEKAETNLYSVEENTVGQFTGLRDKNGKEIYDGDIIHYTHHAGYLLDSFVGEVVWMDDYACFGYSTMGYDYAFADIDEIDSDFLSHVEVIGNIYENPELLTK